MDDLKGAGEIEKLPLLPIPNTFLFSNAKIRKKLLDKATRI